MCFLLLLWCKRHVVVRLWLGILTATTTTPGHVWSGLAGCWLFPLEPRFVRYKLFCASLTTAILRTSQNNRQYVKHSMFRRRRRGCRQIVGVCVCVCATHYDACLLKCCWWNMYRTSKCLPTDYEVVHEEASCFFSLSRSTSLSLCVLWTLLPNITPFCQW